MWDQYSMLLIDFSLCLVKQINVYLSIIYIRDCILVIIYKSCIRLFTCFLCIHDMGHTLLLMKSRMPALTERCTSTFPNMSPAKPRLPLYCHASHYNQHVHSFCDWIHNSFPTELPTVHYVNWGHIRLMCILNEILWI